MQEYTNTICNFYNNLKWYMEKDEVAELLDIMQDHYEYNLTRTEIEKSLNDNVMYHINEAIMEDNETNFWIYLCLVLDNLTIFRVYE